MLYSHLWRKRRRRLQFGPWHYDPYTANSRIILVHRMHSLWNLIPIAKALKLNSPWIKYLTAKASACKRHVRSNRRNVGLLVVSNLLIILLFVTTGGKSQPQCWWCIWHAFFSWITPLVCAANDTVWDAFMDRWTNRYDSLVLLERAATNGVARAFLLVLTVGF